MSVPTNQGSDGPRVAVVIPTHSRSRLLERTLASLARCERPESLVEIIVVENGAPGDARSIVQAFADRLQVRYRHLTEADVSAARNDGVHATLAELLVFHDDDVRVGRRTLVAYSEAARRYGPGHFFGGPVEADHEENPPPEWLAVGLPFCTTGWELGPVEQTHSEFLGANWAAFREDILSAGGFRPGLGPNGRLATAFSETELQARLVRRGRTGVYLPDAKVRHFVPARHCRLGWAWRRRFRQHMTHVLLEPSHEDAPRIAGVPRFLWRQCVEEASKAAYAGIVRPRSEEYTRRALRLAEICGQIRGYRERLRDGGLRASPAAGPAGCKPTDGPASEGPASGQSRTKR